MLEGNDCFKQSFLHAYESLHGEFGALRRVKEWNMASAVLLQCKVSCFSNHLNLTIWPIPQGTEIPVELNCIDAIHVTRICVQGLPISSSVDIRSHSYSCGVMGHADPGAHCVRHIFSTRTIQRYQEKVQNEGEGECKHQDDWL